MASGKRAPRRHTSDGRALAAALDLSNGVSSVVVLQGDAQNNSAAWASFLPHVLAGQTVVRIVKQHDGEARTELERRAHERLARSHSKLQRLLWVAPPDASASTLEELRSMLAAYCREDRDVLLVSGSSVVLIARRQSEMPSAPATSRGGQTQDSRDGAWQSNAPSPSDRAPAPERSEVRWQMPVDAGSDSARRRPHSA